MRLSAAASASTLLVSSASTTSTSAVSASVRRPRTLASTRYAMIETTQPSEPSSTESASPCPQSPNCRRRPDGATRCTALELLMDKLLTCPLPYSTAKCKPFLFMTRKKVQAESIFDNPHGQRLGERGIAMGVGNMGMHLSDGVAEKKTSTRRAARLEPEF